MINNYKLSDSIIAASSYLVGNARVSASGVGQSAVQSLYTIVEYFDSSDVENIKVCTSYEIMQITLDCQTRKHTLYLHWSIPINDEIG